MLLLCWARQSRYTLGVFTLNLWAVGCGLRPGSFPLDGAGTYFCLALQVTKMLNHGGNVMTYFFG